MDDVRELLSAAAGGDEAAWQAIVRRYESLLWSVARSFRLDDADASDVVQTTWLKLVENLDRIVEGACRGGDAGAASQRRDRPGRLVHRA